MRKCISTEKELIYPKRVWCRKCTESFCEKCKTYRSSTENHTETCIVGKLKEMFLAGNKEKNEKSSAENMLRNLQLYAENNEIESDNIPSPQQIKSWISRFNQFYKRQAASFK